MKILFTSLIISTYFLPIFAYDIQDVTNADALAKQGIIVNHTDNPDGYRLEQTITRAEALAVALTLNEIPLSKNHSCKDFF